MLRKVLASCLTVAAVLVVSANAHASRARLTVLGSADPFGVLSRGSMFYDTADNIFYNPSAANDYKNYAIIEKSNGTGTTNTAEGGFVTGYQNFAFGFYMNRGDAISTNPIGAGNTASMAGKLVAASGSDSAMYSTTRPFRPFDVTIAGDMGVKWGLGFTYGSDKRTGTNEAATDATIRAGVQVADFEPFVSYKIIGKNKTGGNENKNTSMLVGTRYRFGEFTPFAAYRYDKNTLTTGANYKSHVMGLGAGRTFKAGEAAYLMYSLSYWRSTRSNQTIVPIDLGVEADLTSWLVGRAGVTFRVWDQANGAGNATDTTSGRIGAAIRAGKVNVEFAVGNGTDGASTTSVDTPAFSFAGQLFSVASLSYNW